jgi:hypothetical protein
MLLKPERRMEDPETPTIETPGNAPTSVASPSTATTSALGILWDK